jgi:hypothetical protein
MTSVIGNAALYLDHHRDVSYAQVSVVTSKKDASKAAKQLTSPKSTPAEKSVAGSDLAQAKGKGKGGASGKTTKKK